MKFSKMNSFRSLLFIAMIALLGSALPGQAQLLAKIDGIDGESDIKRYEKWLNLESMDFSLGRTIILEGSSRQASSPDFSEFTFARQSDSASPLLFIAAAGGLQTAEDDMQIVQLQNVAGIFIPRLRITLTAPIISSYSLSSDGEGPGETFTVNYTRIEYSVIDLVESAGGTVTNSVTRGYNLIDNAPVD